MTTVKKLRRLTVTKVDGEMVVSAVYGGKGQQTVRQSHKLSIGDFKAGKLAERLEETKPE